LDVILGRYDDEESGDGVPDELDGRSDGWGNVM